MVDWWRMVGYVVRTITDWRDVVDRDKAYKKVARKVARAKPCPFCGTVPKFKCHVDGSHSKHGSIGHYAVRERCCPATSSGQTELFFCNDWKTANYGLWKGMVDRLINNWNQRV